VQAKPALAPLARAGVARALTEAAGLFYWEEGPGGQGQPAVLRLRSLDSLAVPASLLPPTSAPGPPQEQQEQQPSQPQQQQQQGPTSIAKGASKAKDAGDPPRPPGPDSAAGTGGGRPRSASLMAMAGVTEAVVPPSQTEQETAAGAGGVPRSFHALIPSRPPPHLRHLEVSAAARTLWENGLSWNWCSGVLRSHGTRSRASG
jgi:hypothetical protein